VSPSDVPYDPLAVSPAPGVSLTVQDVIRCRPHSSEGTVSPSDASPSTSLVTPGDLCREVVRSPGFKTRFGALASHPYNQDQPDKSVWWLFPAARAPYGNWPAYAAAKFMFQRPSGARKLWAGLHVEKGLGAAEAKAFGPGKAKHFAMTAAWAWHDFIDDLANERVGQALASMAERTDLPVEIGVSIGHPLDEPHLAEAYSEYRFVFIPADGTIDCIEQRLSKARLPGFESVSDLPGLSTALLRATREHPFTWINLTIGCSVDMPGASPTIRAPCWRGSDFWNRVLEPLAGWIA
jgi:hypothetical protein